MSEGEKDLFDGEGDELTEVDREEEAAQAQQPALPQLHPDLQSVVIGDAVSNAEVLVIDGTDFKIVNPDPIILDHGGGTTVFRGPRSKRVDLYRGVGEAQSTLIDPNVQQYLHALRQELKNN